MGHHVPTKKNGINNKVVCTNAGFITTTEINKLQQWAEGAGSDNPWFWKSDQTKKR